MIIIPTAARPIDVKQYFVQLLLEWRLLKISLALAGDRTVDRWAAITAFSLLGSHLSAVVHSRYSALWDHNELFDLSSRASLSFVLSAFSSSPVVLCRSRQSTWVSCMRRIWPIVVLLSSWPVNRRCLLQERVPTATVRTYLSFRRLETIHTSLEYRA